MVSCASWLLASSEQTCSSDLHRQLTHFFRKQTKWTKLNINRSTTKRKGNKKVQADKCQKEKKSTNLSQKKYKKQNLPPEEESDDSNERSGG